MRWLLLTLGLGVAAIAGLSLLGVDIVSDVGPSPSHPSQRHAKAELPHSEIDQKSRDQMRAILRASESEGADAQ
jgi:hypothetical protein